MPKDLTEDLKLSHAERVDCFIRFKSHENRESYGQTYHVCIKQQTKIILVSKDICAPVFLLVLFLPSVVRNLFLINTIRKLVLIIPSPQTMFQ